MQECYRISSFSDEEKFSLCRVFDGKVQLVEQYYNKCLNVLFSGIPQMPFIQSQANQLLNKAQRQLFVL